jgi:hypothetical protein
MSYEIVKEFEHRGFKCEIIRIAPEAVDETPFHEFCITGFIKPTTLDKILFFAIGEGLRSDAIAALIDFIGLTSFYPGDFNKDVETIMKIGLIRHEDHVACYTTSYEEDGEVKDHWKYMIPSDMEAMLKEDIDRFHEVRKRMIAAMKLYRGLAQKMQQVMQQVGMTPAESPKT